MVYRHLLVLTLAVVSVIGGKARFDNYQVYRVVPTTDQQLEVLRMLEDTPDGLSFWSSAGRVNVSVDIMVPPHKVADFEDVLHSFRINNHIFIENVQTLIDNEQPKVQPRAGFGWTSYHRLNEIYSWLDSLAARYSAVTPILVGTTFEGRQIRGVKISYRAGNRAVFIEAGIHAREWISPAVTTYIINELLTSQDPQVRNIAETFDWYIVPSSNPDGYEFTHTTNRMWRKTRSRPNILCFGADPNRNWDYQWRNGGASTSACSDTFAGNAAFSEIETRTMAQYISSIATHIDIYISIHSFSQLILIPYGYSNAPYHPNFNTLLAIGQRTADSLARRYNTQYTVGNIIDVLYVASGSSVDWAAGVHNIPFPFIYELRDTGSFGFILPANQIIPSGEETLDSLVTLVTEARNSRL